MESVSPAVAATRKANHSADSCNITRAELHEFADASTAAYVAAVDLRISLDGQIMTLITAKFKPLKIISILRLKLCTALI